MAITLGVVCRAFGHNDRFWTAFANPTPWTQFAGHPDRRRPVKLEKRAVQGFVLVPEPEAGDDDWYLLFMLCSERCRRHVDIACGRTFGFTPTQPPDSDLRLTDLL